MTVMALAHDLDPVTFEVLRHALLAIVEEMGATLRRAAYSTNIKTRGDFSCALFDRHCRVVVQAFAQPSHLGSLTHIVPHAVAKYGSDKLRSGDGLLTNDAYTGGVHLNDITLISPVFAEGELFGFFANIAHHVDVGGRVPGSIGISKDIYEEGLIIPPVRFVKDGVIDENVFALIRGNLKNVHEVAGDFRAQTAANRLGVRRLEELLSRYGRDELERYLLGLMDYTERRVRAAFSGFPHGRYEAESWMDDDGVTDEPVPMRLAVEIGPAGVEVDLTGCPGPRPTSLNATLAQTYAAVVYVLKCLIDPDIAVNDGMYRQVRLRTRENSIVHAAHPTAVAAGWEIAMHLCDLMFRALAQAMPERVMACTKGIVCAVAFGGMNPRTGHYFTYLETIAGGYGATQRTDGMDGVQAHFQNTENAPVEEVEFQYPFRVVRYELIQDSEGAGRHRGGLGIRRDFQFPGLGPVFSILSDRAKAAPWGLFGGDDARPARYVINPDGEARQLPSKVTVTLRPDDIVSVQTPGGGGYGDPRRREPKRIEDDIAQGRIGKVRARDVYGLGRSAVVGETGRALPMQSTNRRVVVSAGTRSTTRTTERR
jgi:N-methylhydantoinase B